MLQIEFYFDNKGGDQEDDLDKEYLNYNTLVLALREFTTK